MIPITKPLFPSSVPEDPRDTRACRLVSSKLLRIPSCAGDAPQSLDRQFSTGDESRQPASQSRRCRECEQSHRKFARPCPYLALLLARRLSTDSAGAYLSRNCSVAFALQNYYAPDNEQWEWLRRGTHRSHTTLAITCKLRLAHQCR